MNSRRYTRVAPLQEFDLLKESAVVHTNFRNLLRRSSRRTSAVTDGAPSPANMQT